MATLVSLGGCGVNIDYVVCWEDNAEAQELYVIFAVPYLDTRLHGTHHLQHTYREEQRRMMLQYLEQTSLAIS